MNLKTSAGQVVKWWHVLHRTRVGRSAELPYVKAQSQTGVFAYSDQASSQDSAVGTHQVYKILAQYFSITDT